MSALLDWQVYVQSTAKVWARALLPVHALPSERCAGRCYRARDKGRTATRRSCCAVQRPNARTKTEAQSSSCQCFPAPYRTTSVAHIHTETEHSTGHGVIAYNAIASIEYIIAVQTNHECKRFDASSGASHQPGHGIRWQQSFTR